MTENKMQDGIYGESPVTDAVLLMGAANEIRRRDIKILELEALLKQARDAFIVADKGFAATGHAPDCYMRANIAEQITAIDKFLEGR